MLRAGDARGATPFPRKIRYFSRDNPSNLPPSATSTAPRASPARTVLPSCGGHSMRADNLLPLPAATLGSLRATRQPRLGEGGSEGPFELRKPVKTRQNPTPIRVSAPPSSHPESSLLLCFFASLRLRDNTAPLARRKTKPDHAPPKCSKLLLPPRAGAKRTQSVAVGVPPRRCGRYIPLRAPGRPTATAPNHPVTCTWRI
jgi:hypothetical protein